jgi:hypothetical protein
MYNNISIIYMNMIKEAVTRKKSQEQNQEKIPGNTIDSIFQVRSIKISCVPSAVYKPIYARFSSLPSLSPVSWYRRTSHGMSFLLYFPFLP